MTELINPNHTKEALGLLIGLAFLGGTLLCMAGIIVAVFGIVGQQIPIIMLGDFLWLLGAGLIVFTLIKNIKLPYGSMFRVMNIAIKSII